MHSAGAVGAIPAELWNRGDMIDSLAARDAGGVLRLVKQYAGLSQHALGALTGIPQGEISLIVTGKKRVTSLERFERLADGLDMPDRARLTLGIAPRARTEVASVLLPATPEPDASASMGLSRMPQDGRVAGHRGDHPSNEEGEEGRTGQDSVALLELANEYEEDPLKRRAFLLSMAAVGGMETVLTTASLERFRHEINSLMIDDSETMDIDEWREIGIEYGQTYLTSSPEELLKVLVTDLTGLQFAMQRHTSDIAQIELRRVAALLAAFIAQSVANMGFLRQARRWWRTARRGADASGDQRTILWVRGREIIRAGFERRPIPIVIQLVQEAEARSDHAPPVLLPQLIAGRAQTMALLGQDAKSEAIQALSRLRAAYDLLPTSVTESRHSLFDQGLEKLHFTESLVFSELGEFTHAAEARDAALALYSLQDARGPAQIQLQQALCLIRAGDVAEGTRHAHGVLLALSTADRVWPIADLAQKVLNSVPASEMGSVGVKDYSDLVESSFAVTFPRLSARSG